MRVGTISLGWSPRWVNCTKIRDLWCKQARNKDKQKLRSIEVSLALRGSSVSKPARTMWGWVGSITLGLWNPTCVGLVLQRQQQSEVPLGIEAKVHCEWPYDANRSIRVFLSFDYAKVVRTATIFVFHMRITKKCFVYHLCITRVSLFVTFYRQKHLSINNVVIHIWDPLSTSGCHSGQLPA